jgi:hypothetical protein
MNVLNGWRRASRAGARDHMNWSRCSRWAAIPAMLAIALWLAPLALAAGTKGYGLFLQNDSNLPAVTLAEGSGASCVNNQGAVNVPQSVTPNNGSPWINIEFTDNLGCKTQSWLFPFVVSAGGHTLAQQEVAVDGAYLGNTTPSCNWINNFGGTQVGVSDSGCASITNGKGTTTGLLIQPVDWYVGGYDISILSNNGPKVGEQGPSNDQFQFGCPTSYFYGCVVVWVTNASSATADTAQRPSTAPRRSDVFAARPQARKASLVISRSGRLTVRVPVRFGAVARALRRQAGANGLLSSASLEVSANAGGRGFAARSSLKLPVAAAHGIGRTLKVSFSAKSSRLLCAAARTRRIKLHVYANQLIDTANHRYGMQASRTLAMRRCT